MKNLKKTIVKIKRSFLFLKKLKVAMAICISACLLLTSCSEDDVVEALGFGCDGSSWEDKYEDALEDLGQATSEFADNPSVQSCNEYKATVLGYYEALEDIYDCIPFFEFSYDEALRKAKADLDAIDCGDYN